MTKNDRRFFVKGNQHGRHDEVKWEGFMDDVRLRPLCSSCIICFITMNTCLGIVSRTMDLFSLYVLFSHFRPRDVTPGNSFFQCCLLNVHMYA